MIKQDELLTYDTYMKSIKDKEAKVRLVKAKLEDLELALIKRVEAGEKVEKGKRYPEIDTTERRSVAWKTVLTKLKGAGYVEELLQKAKPNILKKLKVKVKG